MSKKYKQKIQTNSTDQFINIIENRSGTRPFVSVICPTYNRRKFLPNIIKQFLYQTYPQEFMEMIIVDDSPKSNEDIIPKQSNIKYHYLPEKMILSNKRNYINDLATGDIIVCFDDDDFYSPERVRHAVTKLTSSKRHIAGASVINIYYKNLNKIIQFGPYGPNHGTNGTMAYTRKYLENHRYEDDKNKSEESFFTNNFSEPMVQLDPHNVMLCLAHDSNTIDKDQFIERGTMTNLKLNKYFKHKCIEMIDWIKKEM